MSFGTAFWILMIIWLVYWGWLSWPSPDYRSAPHSLLLFVLLLLLGWATFGAPLR